MKEIVKHFKMFESETNKQIDPQDYCDQENLYPYWFYFDVGEGLIFTITLVIIIRNYNQYILPSIKWKLYFFFVFMTLRPILIYALKDIDLELKYDNIDDTVIYADEIVLYFLFYYMIFKMRIIQIMMEYNL